MQTQFDYANHEFKVPTKNLVTPAHVEQFAQSQGHKELIGFISALSDSCVASKQTQTIMSDVRFAFHLHAT